MASQSPKRGRLKAPGQKMKIVLRESTFNLWNARKNDCGIVGLTHSQFAEMLLHQELGRCARCEKQPNRQPQTQRTSSKLF